MSDRSTGPGDGQHALIETKRRPFAIWLVPIAAILVGIWLIYDTYSKRGPLITITFESGEGLTAGQSLIKFKDVTMGSVESVDVSPDLTHVVVTARMTPRAAPLLTDKARFWVVKPRLFAGQVSGFETVLSGSYVAMLPSIQAGTPARHFTGLEDPPVLQAVVPGRTFDLHAERLGSISLGAPVYYRGLQAGEVLGWDIQDMAQSVTIHVFVRAPFDRYVHRETRFWNASGISLQFGGAGARLKIESLRALLFGGISFDTPVVASNEPEAAVGATFPLYADSQDAANAAFTRRVDAIAYFPSGIGGLAPGSPVTLLGLRIGEVRSVGLRYDPKTDTIQAPVTFTIEPERIGDVGIVQGRGPLENAQRLINLGYRAQVETSNFVTGEKEIALQKVTNAKPAEVTMEGRYVLVPTSNGQFGQIIDAANALLAKVSALPFDTIGQDLKTMLGNFTSISGSPEIRDTLRNLNSATKSASEALASLNGGSTSVIKQLPAIAANIDNAAASATRLMNQVDQGYGADSQFNRSVQRLLAQLNDAVQSFRVLADTLARHPEAIIRGRPDQPAVTK
jgi:paraquat-inducible protein B